MGYRGKKFGASLLSSVLVAVLLLYIVVSASLAVAFMPVLGAGGVYLQADVLEAAEGKVYPEYQPHSTYDQLIGTNTPECEDGIPMYVLQFEGEARALGFELRKDVQVPFIEERWMTIEINDPPVAMSGDNLAMFTSQFGGDSLIMRNVRLTEGRSDAKWGPESGEFILEGGQGTNPTVPGLRATDIEAWVHGATGERITLEPQGGKVNIDISYPKTTEVREFYEESDAGSPLFGYGLEDQNLDFRDTTDADDSRVQRGITDGGHSYFPCQPGQVPVRAP